MRYLEGVCAGQIKTKNGFETVAIPLALISDPEQLSP